MAGTGWKTNSGSISMERLDGETILINFDSGQYFTFVGPAADVLWLVQEGADPATWPESAEAAFPGLVWDDEVQQQVDAFLSDLSEAGVIVPADTPTGTSVVLPADYVREAWVAPSVRANDDLADLLVIDPIHDASEDGWPQVRSGQ
jgi:hypothetical protein